MVLGKKYQNTKTMKGKIMKITAEKDSGIEIDSRIEIAEVDAPHDAGVPSGLVAWIGGKTTHLGWLLPMIPYSLTYAEPFGGSAAVLLARKPSRNDIYNDLDCRLVNLFRVLQDAEKCEKLLNKLDFTLYSRAELAKALSVNDHPEAHDDMDRAWAFFVMCEQMLGANINHREGSWGYGINESYPQPKRWQSRIRRLDRFTQRVKASYIENIDGIQCIRKYDSPTTVFYCDPPYVFSSRKDSDCYRHETSDQYHLELLQCLLECQGAVVLSGYHSELYDNQLKKWHLNERPTTSSLAGRVRGSKTSGVGNVTKFASRTECVWRNPRAMELCNDNLFV